MSSMNSSWYTPLMFTPSSTLESVKVKTYWVRMMHSAVPDPTLDKLLGITTTSSFLFCGPAATGKRTIARALAGTLAARGYVCLELEGSDLDADIPGRVKSLAALATAEQPAVIILREIQSCCNAASAAQQLRKLLHSCEKENRPLIFIAIAEKEEDIPEPLARALLVCRFTLPNEEERTAFYRAAIGESFPLQKGLLPQDLAAAAEELNFMQLRQSLLFSLRALKTQAQQQYADDPESAAAAIREKQVVLDLPTFRNIVAHLKQAKAAVQHAAPVFAAQLPLAEASTAEDPNSKTSKLKNSKSVGEFLDNL